MIAEISRWNLLCNTCWLHCLSSATRASSFAKGWAVCLCLSPLKPFISAVTKICDKQTLAVMFENSVWSNYSDRTYPLAFLFSFPPSSSPSSYVQSWCNERLACVFRMWCSISQRARTIVCGLIGHKLQLKPSWICQTIQWWLCPTSVLVPLMCRPMWSRIVILVEKVKSQFCVQDSNWGLKKSRKPWWIHMSCLLFVCF